MRILVSIVFIFQVAEWKFKHKINHNEFQVDRKLQFRFLQEVYLWNVQYFFSVSKNGENVHFIYFQ